MNDSVTRWLSDLQAGNDAAMAPIWRKFQAYVTTVARNQLSGVPRAVSDEEDVLISVFDTVFRGAADGKFPNLRNRHDFKELLAVITVRKAVDRVRRQQSQKRRRPSTGPDSNITLEELASRIPTPDLQVMASETCRDMLDHLKDESLQLVVVWKMEGFQNAEIAGKLGCALRTVERKLEQIRRRWAKFDNHDS